MSNARLKDELNKYGNRFSNYEGPASSVTLLVKLTAARDLKDRLQWRGESLD